MVGWHESEQDPWDNEEQRSLASCSPWGCEELDMTKQLKNNWTVHFRWVNCMVCKFSQKTATTHTKKNYWEKSQSFIGKNFCWLAFSKVTGYTAHKFIYTCMWVSEQVFAQSCLTLWDPMNCTLQAPLSNSPGKNTGVGCHFLLHKTYMIMQKLG